MSFSKSDILSERADFSLMSFYKAFDLTVL